MDEATPASRVSERAATELDRLGSDKLLIARTDATLETGPVLADAAGELAAVSETFDAWATAEPDERAGEAFETAAATAGDAHESVTAELESVDDAPTPDVEGRALVDALGGCDGTVERAGGLLGYALVADRTWLQYVSFFVNEADRARADLFRDVRADASGLRGEGEAVIEAVATSDADRARAEDAAVAVIEAAYREYADTLEAMGVDPKPVC